LRRDGTGGREASGSRRARARRRGRFLSLRAFIPALVLCIAAPVFAQQKVPRQLVTDAIGAANEQLDLDLAKDQVRSGQRTRAQLAQQEKETAQFIGRLRNHWAKTPYIGTFDYIYNRALKDPAFREDPYHAPPEQPAQPTFRLPAIFRWGTPEHGMLIVFMTLMGLLGLAVLLSFLQARARKKPQQQTSGNYGTADYAPTRAHIPDDLYIYSGVFFGKSSQPGAENVPLGNHQGAPICSTPEHHSLVVARTRTGKGTRVVIPTLLRYMNSCIVIDPKGENAAVTARARAGAPFNQDIHIVNPWSELDGAFKTRGLSYATYNPLDILDRNDPNVVSTAQALAAAICPREKSGKDAYWSDSAASVLTAVLLWLTDQPGEQKTLGRARDIVTRTRKEFVADYLSKMAASSAFDGAIRENAAPFIDLAQETYSGVMSNLAQHTKFLSDPQIKRATASSSFTMHDIMTKLSTLYLIIPPDKMDTQRTWLRLMLTAAMQSYKHRPAGMKIHRCMFLIDEFPALGRMDELPRDIATMSGYGVDFTLIVQGIDQLKAVYGDDATTIVNNCAFKWFCNISDLHTAEYLSKTLGNKTVQTVTSSTSENMGKGGGSTGQSTNYGETGRPLLMPDEVFNLGRGTAILLAPGEKPHYLRPVDYWQLPEAFASLQQFYPDLYKQPPLNYDQNPLVH
jgi:type IV secretion system protein VirD4